jgi:uncharacterized protein YgbK (DUF1537 family)
MIGVIADDTTGANDIGVMFAKQGWITAVLAHDAPKPWPEARVLVLDTDSRLDPPSVAYRKVLAATRRLQALGCTWLHKKTCSVLRGNVGAEFDAMLDATGGEFAVISVAFPKNGRQTCDGVHTVHGVRLEESAFARDPVHPMRESNLVSILSRQAARRVRLISLDVVRQGPEAVRRALEAERTRGGYAVVDAVEQRDLTTLAEAAHDFPWWGGSAAIAEELPRFWPAGEPRDVLAGVEIEDANGVLIVAGSLTPQTRAQTDAVQAAGSPTATLDSRKIFDARARAAEVARVVSEARGALRDGRDTLVMAAAEPEIVAATKALGTTLGLDELTTSKTVSAALADIAHALVEELRLKRLVIAGGDTSGTVCRRLGIRGNYVLREIVSGVPSGLAIGREMLLVLKSGSFGGPDFLLTAAAHLRSLGLRERVAS